MTQDHRRPRRRPERHRVRRNCYRPAVIELEPRRLLSAYVVDDSSDLPLDSAKGAGETANGTITLRSAIQQVNIDGSGSIGFASAMTITTSGLPTITANGVKIDGGSLGSVVVEGNGDGASGLVLAGDDADITGLEIVDFGGDGIDVGATGATIGGTAAGAGNAIFGNVHLGLSLGSFGGAALVQGSFIGTDAAGTAGLGNGESGIYIGSVGNTIGGPSSAARNVISGNAAYGVNIAGVGTTGSVVAGDFIGTNPAGSAALANYTGVEIEGGAGDNLIGTNGDGVNAAAERDVISGNLFAGVCMTGSGTDGNVVAGDFIGTNLTGTTAVGNDSLKSESGAGVIVEDGASRNLIGTTGHSADDAGQHNVISGNIFNDGVYILGAGTGDDVVAGNYIGTTATGKAALQNGYEGILLLDLTTTDCIGVNPLYGTPSADQGNVISGNSAGGIEINATADSIVAGNLIGTDAAGTAAISNVIYDGVFIEKGSTNNLVGTSGKDGTASDALERNVISGNDGYGVSITGAATSDNVVAGNYIGLDRTGSSPLGNGQAGVVLDGGATDNTIGGLTADTRNVIGANGNRGVNISTPAGSSSPTTRNVIEGNYIGTDASGLVPMGNHLNDAVSINLSPGNTIGGTVAGAGNVLDAGDDSGVFIYGDYQLGPYASAGGTLIAGNIIGLAADGVTGGPGFGAGDNGVTVDSAPNTTIGGTVAAAPNIISNNTHAGIMIANFEEPDGAIGTFVQGNDIGTDITGTLARGNAIGVDIEGASSSLIGTDGRGGAGDAAEGNLISGNLTDGVVINGAPATFNDGVSLPGAADNVVAGNLIGTKAGGTGPLGNTGDGVLIEGGATGNTIGGGSAGAANTIADNSGNGVSISTSGTTGNVVEGNYIGTNSAGATNLGNTGDGVRVFDQASGNTIGGTASGAGNVIAENAKGVVVGGSATDTAIHDAILGNSIYGNSSLGIDLADDGVTPNDSSGHSGPYLFQDFPVITDAYTVGSTTTITGTVSGPANSTLRIELFSNPVADTSGYGQGKVFLGYVTVTTGVGGGGSFTFSPSSPVPVGQVVSATATDDNSDTSEFAQDVTVSANAPLDIIDQITGPTYNPIKHTYTETVKLTNRGTTTVDGFEFVLEGLTPGVTLTNKSGTTSDGSPYVTVSTPLSPGQSTTVTLIFTKSSPSLFINYTPKFVSLPPSSVTALAAQQGIGPIDATPQPAPSVFVVGILPLEPDPGPDGISRPERHL